MSLTLGIYCARCSRELDVTALAGRIREDFRVTVEPCRNCEDSAIEDSRQRFYNDGYEDGVQEGRNEKG